jgi:hypothetical protein
MDERDTFEAAIKADRYSQALHFAFADYLEEHGLDDEAAEQRRWTPEWQESVDWLHDFVQRTGGTCTNYNEAVCAADEQLADITYEQLIQAGHDWILNGDDFVQHGSDNARNLMQHNEVREQFWQHWAIAARTEVAEDKRGRLFSCSC